MTIIEQILAKHAGKDKVTPGDIVDITIDVRLARDFGGANVVKNIEQNNLSVIQPESTFFTFDCNPTGSDQKYAANQQVCRVFARNNAIKVYDINEGIGTHLAIDKGLTFPGATVVSTDSHANILGAIGAFGQGMGDRDIAAAWSKGKVWFKVPKSIKISLVGKRPNKLSAKDIVLNLLKEFGANTLLGFSVELYGEIIEGLSLDERITISSMATEMGAIAILIPPSEEVLSYLEHVGVNMKNALTFSTENASYHRQYTFQVNTFKPMISRPGHPHDVAFINEVYGRKIDSAFVGSCTNGRMEDIRQVAAVLEDRKIAPGVVFKVVPSTDEIWQQCMHEGIFDVLKSAGALIGNAGCAGCASGQIGQNGPGEVTISSGNRNFTGKQGKGEVYLASPAVVAASAVAGFITTPDQIPEEPAVFSSEKTNTFVSEQEKSEAQKDTILEGRCWLILQDDIDTDMIFHNRHLAITDAREMGQYAFGNLNGFEDFSSKVQVGDIIITGKNFGAGSSRQQAVDCFKALGVQLILAESFGAIYERNAINAGFPILSYSSLDEIDIKDKDRVRIDLSTGYITNLRNKKKMCLSVFSDVQMEIYQKGDLLYI